MRLRYDKQDNVLMIWFSKDQVDHAQQDKEMIIHFSKKDKPVLLEILDASKFLKRTSHLLPSKII